MRAITTIRHTLVAATALACSAAMTVDASAEPADRRGIEGGPALEFLWGPFSTLDGPWLLAGAAVDVRWASAFHLRTKPLLAIGRTSRTAGGYPTGEVDESTMLVGGGALRLLPSVDLGSTFVARLGPVAIVLFGDYSSSVCGNESYRDFALGGSAELGVRFGHHAQFELAAQFDFIPVTPPKCTNQSAFGTGLLGRPPPRNEPEDNVGHFVGGALTWLWVSPGE